MKSLHVNSMSLQGYRTCSQERRSVTGALLNVQKKNYTSQLTTKKHITVLAPYEFMNQWIKSAPSAV